MSADILLEIAWKTTIVSGAIVALLTVMARQAPSNRVAVGGLGLASLILLPAAIIGLAAYPAPVLELAPPPAMPLPELLALANSVAAAPAQQASSTWQEALILLWGLGAGALLLRFAIGLATLRSWSVRAEHVEFPALNRIMRDGGVPVSTKLLVSDDVSAPLSYGIVRPIIMIDRSTLNDVALAEAVVAHEAAHISRKDWPRLVGAKAVVALFWFNPLVWVLERLYMQDVEEAADAEATRFVEPARYAQALLDVARGAAVPVGANSIASGALSKRIRKILTGRRASRWERLWKNSALIGVAAVAAPVAAVQFASPTLAAAVAATPAVIPVSVAAPRAVVAPTPAVTLVDVPAPAATPASPRPVAEVVALAAAVVAAHPHPDEEAIDRAARAAEDAGRRAEEVARSAAIRGEEAARRGEEAARRGEIAAARGREAMRKGMLAGADGMVRGAEGMRKGAASMREEARKLRDPAYRAQKIRQAQDNKSRGYVYTSKGTHIYNNGKVPTDAELVAMIPDLEKGAVDMEKGAVDMLKGAEDMRRSANGS